MKYATPIAAAIAIALAGCSEPATTVPEAVPASPATTASAPATTPEPGPEYEFYLLPREGAAPGDPRIVSTQEHPCGAIDLVRVPSIPMNDPVFVPQFVVEFDAAGNETGKWGIPNEAEVTALDGQRLQFQVDAGRFWVTPDGALEKLADAGKANDVRTQEGMFDCPALPTFANSGAEQCFRVSDAAGSERRIAMEGVCS